MNGRFILFVFLAALAIAWLVTWLIPPFKRQVDKYETMVNKAEVKREKQKEREQKRK